MNWLLILCLMCSFDPGKPDLSTCRKLYLSAASEKSKAEELMNLTANPRGDDLVTGYQGAVRMVMARYYFNPITKWKSFSRGRDMLESAVESQPDNPELRYLRLSIQENAPSFLGYHQHQEEDKSFLNRELTRIQDAELRQMIFDYLHPK
jgi:hypothetical protein